MLINNSYKKIIYIKYLVVYLFIIYYNNNINVLKHN